MSSVHTVKQGEHIVRLANQYGFRSHKTIWDHPENADLRALRQNPNVLLPGDQVYIPDKEDRTEDRSTGARHIFQVEREKLLLRLVIRDFDHLPIPDADCELELDDQTYQATTDGDGNVEFEIPKDAETGTLRVPSLDIEREVRVGHLDPPEGEQGWQARLLNIGYYAGTPGALDEKQLRYAVQEFQCDFGLDVTGELDGDTKDKLLEVHGS